MKIFAVLAFRTVTFHKLLTFIRLAFTYAMASMAKAGEGVIVFLADEANFLFCLNFGKVLQFGQYHVLSTLTIWKQER